MKRLLVTGSSGLIGSEVVAYFAAREGTPYEVWGVDNNMRESFFGPQGSTRWNQKRLEEHHSHFKHVELDIRHRGKVQELIQTFKPHALVHAAAQPSHDLAASRVFDDFDVNAGGTLNLLEATRQFNKDCVFVHLSTNKVYGDAPNTLPLKELDRRYDYADSKYAEGIAENFPVDQSLHSLFGASKLAGDILVQEYGRYFQIPTACLRGGCLTGPNHSGVELHGFLSYLIKTNIEEREYRIYGYKGKQVRDNIHSLDVARFIEAFIETPRIAEVYNLGGGKTNSVSILEAFEQIETLSGKKMRFQYVDQARVGDHICYYSDLTKMKNHFPKWSLTKNLSDIFDEVYRAWVERLK